MARKKELFGAVQHRQMVDRFFKAETKTLETATKIATMQAARVLRRKTLAEIKRNFKPGPGGSAGFFKAVKIHDLPTDIDRGLGPVSYVRLGVPWIKIFQEGGTVEGQPTLSILLPEGQRLGFKRLTKGNPWKAVWERWGKHIFFVDVSDGRVAIFSHPKDGKNYPIYKFQRSVDLPKKLSFIEMARELGAMVPGNIERLMQGDLEGYDG